MLKYRTHRDPNTQLEWIETTLKGKTLLSIPLLNKGTAFSIEERKALNLLGKLPYRVESLDEQVLRAKNQFNRYSSTLQKYIYLNNLHDKNEILFYKLLLDNLEETIPLIYTPGVSDAVKEFSHEFRQPRGLYLAYPDRDKMSEMLDNRTHADIEIIVVTDGERILGIGDQGIGGMDIPIAKLVVYSLCGVNPYKTLPIMLDVGTDNPDLLNHPLYLGWKNNRIRGQEYDDFLETFVTNLKQKFPKSFLHWEDFGQQNARKLLERYRTEHCSFNDDMQGTGVVTLAALLAAIDASQKPLEEQRILVFGAGTAGVGIADMLHLTLLRHGIDPKKAKDQFWLLDRHGILYDDMPNLAFFQHSYTRDKAERKGTAAGNLLDAVQLIKPTILIGCSTVGGAFSEEVVKEMAKYVERPIIFPLSNPNQNCEQHPANLIKWTKGKALIATGSPFAPVEYDGISYPITQCNNALSFPGIGLAVIATKATQVTDTMLLAAASALCSLAPVKQDKTAPLLPAIPELATVAIHVALAVAKQAIEDKVATQSLSLDFEQFVHDHIWRPYYREIRPMKGEAGW